MSEVAKVFEDPFCFWRLVRREWEDHDRGVELTIFSG